MDKVQPSSKKNSARSTTQQSLAAATQNRKDTPTAENMSKCKTCGRNFNSDRLDKHETICQKTAAKNRKVFDSTSHRIMVSRDNICFSYIKLLAR